MRCDLSGRVLPERDELRQLSGSVQQLRVRLKLLDLLLARHRGEASGVAAVRLP